MAVTTSWQDRIVMTVASVAEPGQVLFVILYIERAIPQVCDLLRVACWGWPAGGATHSGTDAASGDTLTWASEISSGALMGWFSGWCAAWGIWFRARGALEASVVDIVRPRQNQPSL